MLSKDKFFNLPNILSLSRAVLMPVLFYLVFNITEANFKALFVVVYIVAGLTDSLDGYIARRYDICTDLGSNLDSYADILYYLGSAVFVYVLAKQALIDNIYFFIFTIAMFIMEIVISTLKFEKPLFIHTVLSKFSGFMVFVTVIVAVFTEIRVLLSVTILLYGLSFIENIVIFYKYGEVSPDTKGLLFIRSAD